MFLGNLKEGALHDVGEFGKIWKIWQKKFPSRVVEETRIFSQS